MHGPSYAGDCVQALHDLADAYASAVRDALFLRPHDERRNGKNAGAVDVTRSRASPGLRRRPRRARGRSVRRRARVPRPRRVEPADSEQPLGRAGHGRSRAGHDRDVHRLPQPRARHVGGRTKLKGSGPQVDGLTAHQVALTAGLTTTELIGRLGRWPRNARWRARRRVLRNAPLKQTIPGNEPETWRMGYCSTSSSRVTPGCIGLISRRQPVGAMELTAEHDGRIVADAVAEWARRHGTRRSCSNSRDGRRHVRARPRRRALAMDAVEFCRIISGRPAAAEGLLAVQVPF